MNLEVAQEAYDDFGVIDSLVERLDNLTIDMDNVLNTNNINSERKSRIKVNICEAKELVKELRIHLIGDEVESIFD